MKKFVLILALCLFLMSFKIYSVDTAAVKYYPLAIGNSWTYSYVPYPMLPYLYKNTVTGTTSMNGHFYYIITTYRNGYAPVNTYQRIDSLKNNVLIYSTSGCPWLQNEITADSLSARLGDSSKTSCSQFYKLNDTSNITVFGSVRKRKGYIWSDYFEHGTTRILVKGIGYYSSYTTGPFGFTSENLTGCYINGDLYGDTSLTGITKISSEVPGEFSLSQNYPNPFNPSTTIKFDIPKAGNVLLKIYDITGKEVYLINDFKAAGQYETTFDASNFASGVYYYKLESGSFTETKKMVLIK